MANLQTQNKSRKSDLVEMLLAAGVGQYNYPMAIQFMNFLPQTCDPYAAGVILIVQGMQNMLNKRGAKLAVDGVLGQSTVNALIRFSGPRWYDKSWSQLYGDIMSGEYAGPVRQDRSEPRAELAGFASELVSSVSPSTVTPAATPPSALKLPASGRFAAVLASPITWTAAGVFVWWKFLRKSSNRRSR